MKNRFVLSPMTRSRADASLLPNDLIRDYYAQFESAGLIITEASHVSEQARGWVNVPGIWTQEQATKWKAVTDAVHAKGNLIFLQLWHQGRSSHSSFHNGKLPVAPSPIKLRADVATADQKKAPAEVPHALTIEEIKQVIEDFRNGAVNAKAAGFDGVELHGANGYLLDEFLQSKTNQRTDTYGGSIENRFRIVGEALDAIISVWGKDRVGVRFSPNGAFNEMGSPDFREQISYALTEVGKRGVAFVDLMDGLAFGFHKLGAPFTIQEARAILPAEVALMGNCGYTPETAEATIGAGNADLIAFGRPYLANPDLPERVANGWPLAKPPSAELWYSPTADYPSGKGYIMPKYQPAQ